MRTTRLRTHFRGDLTVRRQAGCRVPHPTEAANARTNEWCRVLRFVSNGDVARGTSRDRNFGLGRRCARAAAVLSAAAAAAAVLRAAAILRTRAGRAAAAA